ncbi:MAG: TRM11 family SAM-dependent methyltransferase [Phycisphaerales bacterium]
MNGPPRPPRSAGGGQAPGDRRPPPGPRGPRQDGPRRGLPPKPPLRVHTTTLWEYPSQDYEGFTRAKGAPVAADAPHSEPAPDEAERGVDGGYDPATQGATPSWVIWQLLTRYTRPNDLVIDPMAGAGTTLDVARHLGRRSLGYDLTPRRPDVFRADARKLPLEDGKADFIFIDPPYSTHLEYSTDPRDIGGLDAAGENGGRAYYAAMEQVFTEAHRVLRDRRYLGVYASDSWRKRKGGEPGSGAGVFMPIGFEFFAILRALFKPVDVVCVVRHNAKLKRGNWHRAAEQGNFFLRGFNYLLIMKKEDAGTRDQR